MTINEYIQQEEHKYYIKQELGYDLVSSTFCDGLSHGLDIGMRFSEWASTSYEYSPDHDYWLKLVNGEWVSYTTKQLLEIFIDHLNKKG